MNVQQSCGLAHALPAGWHPTPVPPVPVLVPPVLVPPPPAVVLAPPAPEAPPLAPPAPEVSTGVDELPPHVINTMLENNTAAPANTTRRIMWPPNPTPLAILPDASLSSPVVPRETGQPPDHRAPLVTPNTVVHR